MKSDKYWAARAAKRMDWAMLASKEISDLIGAAYLGALRDIQSQLDSIFRNFSAGISQAEALRILNQVSIGRSSSVTDMLKRALDLVSDPEDRAKLLAEINAPAYKYRMQRLKELAEDAGKKCAEIARTTRSELDGGLAGIVRDSYFRGIFDMQQGTGLAFSFSKISDRQVREILSQDWSGAHYSKRIWQNTNALAAELQNTLLKGVLTGASSGRMAAEIQQRFHASYSRALTLTRTESSHCANSAELRRYEETGVKKYRYVATLDSHTSDICQELDGQEFPVEDASPGTNYPPMHPRCRSTTIAALSPALMQKLERRARDPETGKLTTVPADMTYREWYGKYVEDGELTGDGEGDIIKSITVKSFDDADPDKAVSDECRQVILDTLKSQGVSYVYDDVEIISIPRDKDGRIEPLRTNAISRPRYPKVVLEVNEEALAGKSMEKINEIFALQNYSVAKSLEEAIIHESAHAKVIDGRSYEEYEEIDKELKGYKFTGPIASRADKKSLRDLAGEISEYAQKDGLECIAECHVKLSRGETIPAELKELHDRFIK